MGINLKLDIVNGRLKTFNNRWYNYLLSSLVSSSLPIISIILFLLRPAPLYVLPTQATYLAFQRHALRKLKLNISRLKPLDKTPRTTG